MPHLQALVYVSAARRVFTPADVAQLLHRARATNSRCGVTGVLLNNDGNFMQYLEGPAEGLQQVYTRIQQDGSHTGIIELLRLAPAERVFPHWPLAYRDSASCLALSPGGVTGEPALVQRLRCEGDAGHLAQMLLARFWGGGCQPGLSCHRESVLPASAVARCHTANAQLPAPGPGEPRPRAVVSINRFGRL